MGNQRNDQYKTLGGILCGVLLSVVLLCGCSLKKKPLPAPRLFYHDLLLPTTPVKDQGSSSLCWAYAMLATIETEHLVPVSYTHLTLPTN